MKSKSGPSKKLKGVGSEFALVLHNIRSTHNVGSIFRTAECAGVTGLYLCGYTPTPMDRFGRPRKDIAKVALGAEDVVPWKHELSTSVLLKRLKKEGWRIIALEQAEYSVDYKKIKIGSKKGEKFLKNVLILGNEVGGIENSILKLCDHVAEIPLRGEKESLNVSVATGVAVFSMLGV